MFKTDYQEGQKMTEFLAFVKRDENSKPGRPKGIFLCVCGKEFSTRFDAITGGKTKSCGCQSKQLISKFSTKHAPAEYISPGIKKMPNLQSEDVQRFWSKVDCDSNLHHCWNWTAGGDRYGDFRVGKHMYKSNRIAYWLWYGVEPADLSVMHTCDNARCCNHTHLVLGTHEDNMGDMADKGRAKKAAPTTVKLNAAKVREMRRLYSEGETLNQLSFLFNVSERTIHSVVNKFSWRNIS